MDTWLQVFKEITPYLTHPLVLIGFLILLLFGLHRTLLNAGIIPPLTARTGGKVVQILLRYGFAIALVVIVLGFALQLYRTYRETQPPSDVRAIIEQMEARDYREVLRIEDRYQEEMKDWKKDELYLFNFVFYAAISGGAGGFAWFLVGLKSGHYRNNKIVRKFLIEILGAIVTASFLAFVLLPGDNYRVTVAVAFAIGVGWTNILHMLRTKITAIVEAALGERQEAGRTTTDKKGT